MKIDSKLRDILVSLGFVAVAALLVVAGILAWNHFIKTPPYVDPVKYPIRGIDISSHNGIVDFKKVANDGYAFVFIKASEGADFRDTYFRDNYHRARKAGLKTGAYHFFRFDRDGIEQAQNLASAIDGCTLELGVAIDIEDHGNVDGVDDEVISEQLTNMVDFLNMLGHRVVIYSNKDGYFDYIHEALPGCTLWICSFSPNPINTEWTFWQYNHRGKVKGIEGDVDLDAFCGSEADWRRYLQGAPWPYEN